jgi:hypothetical protein
MNANERECLPPGARASARFNSDCAAALVISSLPSIGTLKRRERRAPFQE